MPNDSPPDSIVGSAADTPSHERRRRAGTAALDALATDPTLMIETGGTWTGDFTGAGGSGD